MNTVHLIGNIGNDLEIKKTPSGKSVVEINLAVSDFGKEKKTYWFKVSTWEKTAENIYKYCVKGSKIAVTGKLIQDTWIKDGQKQSRVSVLAREVEFVGSAKDRTEKPLELKPAPKKDYKPVVNEEFSYDDIPF